jgi:hypothetical protein
MRRGVARLHRDAILCVAVHHMSGRTPRSVPGEGGDERAFYLPRSRLGPAPSRTGREHVHRCAHGSREAGRRTFSCTHLDAWLERSRAAFLRVLKPSNESSQPATPQSASPARGDRRLRLVLLVRGPSSQQVPRSRGLSFLNSLVAPVSDLEEAPMPWSRSQAPGPLLAAPNEAPPNR